MKLASTIYEIYRLLAKPHTHGALVAIWEKDKLLLVKSSYYKGYSLPGGGVTKEENNYKAAVRELREELGLTIESINLTKAQTTTEEKAGGKNTVTIFELDWLDENEKNKYNSIEIDEIEIVGFRWMKREEALKREIPSHLRSYLKNKINNGNNQTK